MYRKWFYKPFVEIQSIYSYYGFEILKRNKIDFVGVSGFV